MFYGEIESNGNNPIAKSEHNSVSFDVDPRPSNETIWIERWTFCTVVIPVARFPLHGFYFAGSGNIYNPL